MDDETICICSSVLLITLYLAHVWPTQLVWSCTGVGLSRLAARLLRPRCGSGFERLRLQNSRDSVGSSYHATLWSRTGRINSCMKIDAYKKTRWCNDACTVYNFVIWVLLFFQVETYQHSKEKIPPFYSYILNDILFFSSYLFFGKKYSMHILLAKKVALNNLIYALKTSIYPLCKIICTH